MTTPAAIPEGAIPIADIEKEISIQLDQVKEPGEAPAQRARMSNLVIVCQQDDLADEISNEVPAIVAIHPARVLLLVAQPGPPDERPTYAFVRVWCRPNRQYHVCSDQIILHTKGNGADALPFAVRRLLVGDMPTNVWWATPQPPGLAGPLLYDLADQAQVFIYDSLGWPDPVRGVASTGVWLSRFEPPPGGGRYRVACDLNWRRLRYWRRLLSQALDPSSAPGVLESISEVLIEHGPHAVTQAWMLVGWLASRLGWKVQASRVQPGVEISWQVAAPRGMIRIRVRRLPEGPTEIHKIRFACMIAGEQGALSVVSENSQRLSAVPEGLDVAPRTLSIQQHRLSDLVGRQLSDRERDPVFRRAMEVAQLFAQSLQG